MKTGLMSRETEASTVPVERVSSKQPSRLPVLDEMEQLMRRVRERAFSLFEERGAVPGRELDDWLRAERELLWSPHAELREKDNEFELRVAAPGLGPNDIRV